MRVSVKAFAYPYPQPDADHLVVLSKREQANTDECNLTFPDECEEACEAFAPIPF